MPCSGILPFRLVPVRNSITLKDIQRFRHLLTCEGAMFWLTVGTVVGVNVRGLVLFNTDTAIGGREREY